MDIEHFKSLLADDAILLKDLDAAIIGYDDQTHVPVYSYEGILEGLQANNDWEYFEAVEWYGYNIASLLPGNQFRVVIMEFV